MTTPRDKQEELALQLNAYIDGELSDAQRRRVEDRLRDDPEARQLMDELRAVTAAVRALPPVHAQVDFTEAVQRQLERDLLIGDDSDIQELVGQRHLILRKLVAAAAIILLAGGVVMIAYTVLWRQPHRPDFSADPILNIPPSPQVRELAQPPELLAVRPDDAVAGSAEPLAPSTALMAATEPSYATLSFRISTPEPAAAAAVLENILARHDIEPVVNDQAGRHYALLCPRATCQALLEAIEAETGWGPQMSLTVTDPLTEIEVSIPAVTAEQAMAMAADQRPHMQHLLAQRFAAHNRGDKEASGRRDQLFAYGEPSLPELQRLADTEAETADRPGFSPNETIDRPEPSLRSRRDPPGPPAVAAPDADRPSPRPFVALTFAIEPVAATLPPITTDELPAILPAETATTAPSQFDPCRPQAPIDPVYLIEMRRQIMEQQRP